MTLYSGKNKICTTNSTEGVVPTGTINIAQAGNYNVFSYANANINVQGIPRKLVNNTLQWSDTTTFSLPSNATDLGPYTFHLGFYGLNNLISADLSSLISVTGEYALCNAFYSLPLISSVDLSNLTTVNANSALLAIFHSCSNLSSVDLSNLTTVSGDLAMNVAFRNCSSLTSLDLSNLRNVSGYATMTKLCAGCSNLTSVDLSNLTTVNGEQVIAGLFDGVTSLTSVDLSSLTTIPSDLAMYKTFAYTSLKSLSLPSLNSNSFGSHTNQFSSMLSGVTGCTVHFPSNLQSVIGSWYDVTSGFEGTNTTVLFDLPATT